MPDKTHELTKVFADLFKGTFGRTGFDNPDKPRIGHGIGFKFTVFPTNIGKEKRIVFDVTRQKEAYALGDAGYLDKDIFPKDDRPNDDDGDEKGKPQ